MKDTQQQHAAQAARSTPTHSASRPASGLDHPSAASRSNSAHAASLQRMVDVASNSARAGMATAQREATSGNGLPDTLKSGIETLSGMSMDHVKVHTNSPEPARIHAHAYTQGSNIYLAPGQEKHLAHEAWHVVQQAQGRVRPTLQMKSGMQVNDDGGLEAEADTMGAQAAATGKDGRSLPDDGMHRRSLSLSPVGPTENKHSPIQLTNERKEIAGATGDAKDPATVPATTTYIGDPKFKPWATKGDNLASQRWEYLCHQARDTWAELETHSPDLDEFKSLLRDSGEEKLEANFAPFEARLKDENTTATSIKKDFVNFIKDCWPKLSPPQKMTAGEVKKFVEIIMKRWRAEAAEYKQMYLAGNLGNRGVYASSCMLPPGWTALNLWQNLKSVGEGWSWHPSLTSPPHAWHYGPPTTALIFHGPRNMVVPT